MIAARGAGTDKQPSERLGNYVDEDGDDADGDDAALGDRWRDEEGASMNKYSGGGERDGASILLNRSL